MKQEFNLEKLDQLFKIVDGKLVRKITTSSRSKAGDIAGNLTKKGYLQVRFDGKICFVHRIIWVLHNKKNILKNFEIDHINRCKSDNNITNLRLATRSQNAANIKSKKQFKGVYFEKDRNKWVATSKKFKKNYKIGRYETQEEAAKAYDEYVKNKFGEFAVVNL